MASIPTAGQLRKILSDAKSPFQIDNRLQDGDQIVHHATGADLTKMVKVEDVARTDITPYLQAITANPFLRQRRIERGFLKAENLPNILQNIKAPIRRTVGPDTAASAEGSPRQATLERVVATPVAATVAPAPAPAGSGVAASVDWRNRFGWPWLTKIKDQDPCGSCWCFSATGVVEAMTRIEHGVWALRSEGDVHDGMGYTCAQGGWPSVALDWIKAHGAADAGCWAYQTHDLPYKPTPDRDGRTVRLDSYVSLNNNADQKAWLDAVGPLSACFTCYWDFQAYGPNSGTYICNEASGVDGGHCIVIVGYDDERQAWLVRNSWGTGWGMEGYCWFGYGQAGIDSGVKYGVPGASTNPDPWTKRRVHAGGLYESGNGPIHRNFEFWAVAPGSAIRHYWRDGGTLDWHVAETFANDCGGSPAATGTTYNRNFELIYRTTNARLHHRYYDQAGKAWHDGPTFGPPNVEGIPAFLQGDYGAPGNFEVVVRVADGSLVHWWRDEVNFNWQQSAKFGSNIAHSAPAMIQRFDRGLELIAVNNDGTMQRWLRDDAHHAGWQAFEKFGSNVQSAPVMLEGMFGAPDEVTPGNYELCVAVNGTAQHWWRNNVDGAGTWSMSATFGENVAGVVGMIEGSFGFDLEVILLLKDGKLQHYWRNGSWNAGPVIGTI